MHRELDAARNSEANLKAELALASAENDDKSRKLEHRQ